MSKRILVVEEEPQMRARLVEVLRGAGLNADTAAHGPGALSLASNLHYDALIINAALTGMDGLETCSRLKARFPGMGVVVISAVGSEELMLRAMRAGARDFLLRPFTPEELIQAVQRQLSTRPAANQDAQSHLVRKTLLQALQAITLMLDLSGVRGRPLPGLNPLGVLARQLAQAHSLPPGDCEEIQLSTWLQALCELPGESPMVVDREELPLSIQEILNGLDSDEPSVQSKLVALVLALGRGDDITEKGRFDPELVELVLRRNRSGQSQAQEIWHKRSLLSRARALDLALQQAEAIHLYEQVLKADPSSADGIEAALALARLRQRTEVANQAIQTAQRVGPWLNAETCFEAGIVLSEIKPGSAETALQRATRLYRDLECRHRQALATIAQERFSSTALSPDLVRSAVETLGSFPERELLSRHLDWLAPWLLAYPDFDEIPEALKLIQGWLEEDSERIANLLRQGGWPEAARLGLARALTRLPWVPGDEVVRVLRSDSHAEVRQVVAGDKVTLAPGLPPCLRIYSLGPLEVYQGRRRLSSNAWRTQRARHLFAYLAAHSEESHSGESLIELFLSDDPRIERLNQVLEAARSSLRPRGQLNIDYIQENQGHYRLNPQLPRWHDLEQLERSHLQAGQLEGKEAADQHRRIVTLARGQFLEDTSMDWVLPIRERVQEKVCNSLLWLARWSQKAGRPAESYEHATRLAELAPQLDEAGVLVMDSLVGLNRIEEALRYFERYKNQGNISEALQTAQKRAISALTY